MLTETFENLKTSGSKCHVQLKYRDTTEHHNILYQYLDKGNFLVIKAAAIK